MRIIHVLRKPLSEGTVAANTLKHGTGGLNIDASRISSDGSHMRPFQPTNHAGGRWPANVILQHLGGCRRVGTRVSSGYKIVRFTDGAKHFGGAVGHPHTVHEQQGTLEAVWECEPGCPVARLDADSLAGGMHSAGSSRSAKREAGKTGMFPMDGDDHRFGDTGGASRFFKQVGGSDE